MTTIANLYSVHRCDVVADMLVPVAERIVRFDSTGRWSCMINDDDQVDAAIVYAEGIIGEPVTGVAFQGYRDGEAVTPWHDDRTMTGISAILTVGATRLFQIRAYDNVDAFGIVADHGSLIVLHSEFHHHYQHRIGPEPDVHTPRYAFLFRTPVPVSKGH